MFWAKLSNVGTSKLAAAVAALAICGLPAVAQADQLAVETLVKAGWDPCGMLRMFDTLKAEAGGGYYPTFLASHPPTDERIANVRAEIAPYTDTGALRTDDNGKLPLIQRRLELIIGTDSDSDPLDDEELEQELEEALNDAAEELEDVELEDDLDDAGGDEE